MLLTIVLGFIAGFFAGNGLPYYAEGSIGHGVNPSPFRESAAANVLIGSAAFIVAAIAWHFAHVSQYPAAGYGAAALGVLVVGLIHAKVWHLNPFRRRATSAPVQ